MANDMQSRTERAEAYIKKCRRRRVRALRRRERNIARTAELIGRGAGAMALIMVGIVIGGRMV